jgi:thiol:disulfide interchange protein
MIGYIMSVVLLIFSIMRFYKNRSIFKQLSKKEWVQYILGFLFAWIIGLIVIIGGSNLTDIIQIAWLNKGVVIILVLIALTIAGFIMNITLPAKLKKFYS